jgi:hypothetical protein
MAAMNRHHGFGLSQAEEAQYSDHNHDETDDIDNVVHTEPPCFGGMPVRQE